MYNLNKFNNFQYIFQRLSNYGYGEIKSPFQIFDSTAKFYFGCNQFIRAFPNFKNNNKMIVVAVFNKTYFFFLVR